MKALTLTQPWATLVAAGAKKIETRSWRTAYRGPLAIHAAKSFPEWCRELCAALQFRHALDYWYERRGHRLENVLGCVICKVELVDCLSTGVSTPGFSVTNRERAFGDYSLGRFAWIFREIELLPEPIPARGRLGLWEWNEPVESAKSAD